MNTAHSHHINMNDALSPEISAATAAEVARLGLACLIDIRQPFELEVKGVLANALNVPFFNVKRSFGIQLTAEEQEILDADEPDDLDAKTFITRMNGLRQGRDCILLVVCNSGQRSLSATRLLREMGYDKTFSVRGGFCSLNELLNTA